MRHALTGLMVLALLAGCGAHETTANTAQTNAASQASEELSPEDLGRLGAEIEAQPADAEQILTGRGMTLPQFEQEIRRVSSDPQLSKRYAEGFRKAKS
jgi:hypothetical protein